MNSITNLEKDILATLYIRRCIGTKLTPPTQLYKHLNHYTGHEIKKEIINLRKKGYINLYKTYQGIDIRLNKEKLEEIKRIIQFND